MAHMTRLASAAIGLGLVLAACASPGASVSPTQNPTSAPASTPAPPEVTAVPGSTAPPSPAGPVAGSLNTAVVIIGDERYEFSDVQCSILAPRYIQAGNYGGDPEVSIVLPPEGWEAQGDTFSPPSVRVQIGEGATEERWTAGDDGFPLLSPIADGSSQIDSYTVPDGRPVTATGTATFIDVNAHNSGQDAPSMSGSFEVTCP